MAIMPLLTQSHCYNNSNNNCKFDSFMGILFCLLWLSCHQWGTITVLIIIVIIRVFLVVLDVFFIVYNWYNGMDATITVLIIIVIIRVNLGVLVVFFIV